MSAIGLQQGKVTLSPHSKEWERLFEEERAILTKVCGESFVEIHHIGSTSLPGLSAKPIIDILVVLRRFSDMEVLHLKMEEAGYEYRENGSVELRTLFVKGPKEKRTHHIHFTEHLSEEWGKAFAFWDYMRAHPKEARAYEKLKQALALKYPSERDKYSEGKANFIKSTIQKARALKTKSSR